MSIDIKLGDVIRLHKVHPCRSYEWGVIGVGDDIDLKYLKCQRRLLLAKDGLVRKKMKEFVSKSI